MASICNYSHPELQITTGLVRHGSGQLFPYNPEFYDRTSGLYGPGAIICWYMLMASSGIGWYILPKEERGVRTLGVTSDLLAVMAFPAFAATDALIQTCKLVRTADRAVAYFCLRFPMDPPDELMAQFNHTQLNLNPIPPDVLDLGQRILDLTGPITVCYTFTTLSFFIILFVVLIPMWANSPVLPPTRLATILGSAVYGYAVLVLIVFHFSLGDIHTSFLIFRGEFTIFWFYIMILVLGIFSPVIVIGCLVSVAQLRTHRDKPHLYQACGFASFTLGLVVLPLAIVEGALRLVPDLAISIKERDQLATLLVGIATLCFTLYELFRPKKEKEPTNDVEMQPLATETEGE